LILVAVTLAHAASGAYPGASGVTGVKIDSILVDDLDSPDWLYPAVMQNLQVLNFSGNALAAICAANCFFKDAWKNASTAVMQREALEIGPDASNLSAAGLPTNGATAQINQGAFSNSEGSIGDIAFDTDTNGKTCNCSVALGAGMISLDAPNNIPSTNDVKRTLGTSSYAPPTFANAATVGVPAKGGPLTLNPAELGFAVSSDTATDPGIGGLKLRVECGTSGGTAKIVAFAGSSGPEKVILDNIGTGVFGC